MSEYRSLVLTLAEATANQRISNGKAEHAAALLEAMFRHAKDVVRLFSGELDQATYKDPRLADAACDFVQRGKKLNILLQKPPEAISDQSQQFLQRIRECAGNHGGSVVVKVASGSYADPEVSHFAVMDNVGYRYEYDHGGKRALANFNEPPVASKLADAFDAAFGMGRDILQGL